MQYALLIYEDETLHAERSEEAFGQMMQQFAALNEEMNAAGVRKAGEALDSVKLATTVRVRGSETLVTDGPFAETKEQLGGFYLVECDHLDQAIEYAAKIPLAASGSIEIRPVWDYRAAMQESA